MKNERMIRPCSYAEENYEKLFFLAVEMDTFLKMKLRGDVSDLCDDYDYSLLDEEVWNVMNDLVKDLSIQIYEGRCLYTNEDDLQSACFQYCGQVAFMEKPQPYIICKFLEKVGFYNDEPSLGKSFQRWNKKMFSLQKEIDFDSPEFQDKENVYRENCPEGWRFLGIKRNENGEMFAEYEPIEIPFDKLN